MGRKRPTEHYRCEDCGAEWSRPRRGGRPKLCTECGVARAVSAARQMATKSGDAYDRWRTTAGPSGRPRKSTELE